MLVSGPEFTPRGRGNKFPTRLAPRSHSTNRPSCCLAHGSVQIVGSAGNLGSLPVLGERWFSVSRQGEGKASNAHRRLRCSRLYTRLIFLVKTGDVRFPRIGERNRSASRSQRSHVQVSMGTGFRFLHCTLVRLSTCPTSEPVGLPAARVWKRSRGAGRFAEPERCVGSRPHGSRCAGRARHNALLLYGCSGPPIAYIASQTGRSGDSAS